ncbi:MAG: hypothetical protein GY795_37050 [Desulfobacterales bacterium]|nr:hypothetical protein [Desulfobacterales bacterium]
MPFLLANDLDLDEFLHVVKNYSCPDEPLLMAFSPARACFEVFSFDESFLAATEQGRIFSPDGELKWRRTGTRMRVVYLGNKTLPEKLEDCSSELDGLEREESDIILWGVRTDTENEWIEQQVPHRFSYHVSGKNISRGRIAIVVEKWTDLSGLPRFSRYHTLKEIQMPGRLA